MDFVKLYAKIIVNHPIWVIGFALLFTVIGISQYGNIVTNNPSVDEILPPTMPVVAGINKLTDNLGGGEGTAFMVVIELEPTIGSQIYDIRDPEVLKYSRLLAKQINQLEDITGTLSVGDELYYLNNNNPVNSLKESKRLINENPFTFSRIVNEKYSLTLIRVNANSGFDVSELVKEVTKVIENTPKPQGVKTLLAGESIANKISEDLTGPDSAKTSLISIGAIVVILLFAFRHLVYGTLPLFTILFGVMWVFGFIAISGIPMSNSSSGAISMIVGIGIDFGIQTIMRFRSELEKSKPVLAMQKTMENVLMPMFITTVASFIGFWSMTLGEFTILGELGKIMAFGVIYCFLAAITVVPAISVLFEEAKLKWSKKN